MRTRLWLIGVVDLMWSPSPVSFDLLVRGRVYGGCPSGRGRLMSHPPMLLTALNIVGARRERKGHYTAKSVSGVVSRNPRLRKKCQRPELGTDQLYQFSFIHPDRDQLSTYRKVLECETLRKYRKQWIQDRRVWKTLTRGKNARKTSAGTTYFNTCVC